MGKFRDEYYKILDDMFGEDGTCEYDSHEDERDAYEISYDRLCGLIDSMLDVMKE